MAAIDNLNQAVSNLQAAAKAAEDKISSLKGIETPVQAAADAINQVATELNTAASG